MDAEGSTNAVVDVIEKKMGNDAGMGLEQRLLYMANEEAA